MTKKKKNTSNLKWGLCSHPVHYELAGLIGRQTLYLGSSRKQLQLRGLPSPLGRIRYPTASAWGPAHKAVTYNLLPRPVLTAALLDFSNGLESFRDHTLGGKGKKRLLTGSCTPLFDCTSLFHLIGWNRKSLAALCCWVCGFNSGQPCRGVGKEEREQKEGRHGRERVLWRDEEEEEEELVRTQSREFPSFYSFLSIMMMLGMMLRKQAPAAL